MGLHEACQLFLMYFELFKNLQVFLGCLPTSVTAWQGALSKSRGEYEVIKAKHVTNPHVEAKGRDLQLENPLSLHDRVSWQC